MKEFEDLQTQNDELSTQLLNKIDEIDTNLDQFGVSTITKSNQIEGLLFYCDRTNGEINTSINLKVRNLIEKRDALLQKDDKFSSICLYNVLENLIVLMLWAVWVFVELWRLVKGILLVLWKLLKWIFL
ncbi:unnamed protein product [Ambrosiozyma monospora]|uniref:Unnamed protein product n=1 Tax=Ambrosiozyma monospora TaxID=43982 RepID=A0ACB5TCJ9_AMBMO|nr:unnamed protein product [Ambrosiozyma monospora]